MIKICKCVKEVETTKEMFEYIKSIDSDTYMVMVETDSYGDTEILAEYTIRTFNMEEGK